jgi:signal transduction histidine kinase
VAILVASIVVSPLGTGQDDIAEVAIILAITAVIIAIGWLLPWHRVGVGWQVVIPFSIILLNPFLRDATGGAASGASILILPMLWIALYHSRLAVLLGVLAVSVTYVSPQFLFDPANYPSADLELRRAFTASLLYGTMALIIHRLINQLNAGRREMQESNEQLGHAYQREREMVAELTELDGLKSRFIAIASHELRTPLTSITGFTQTILERWEDLTDTQKRSFIEVVDQQGERLSKLVDDLLVLSRIQSSSIETQPRTLVLHRVLKDAAKSAHTQDIRLEVAENLVVFADELHVQRIVTNFVTNALKYGQTPVTIRAEAAHEDWVEIRVCDCGPGVDPRFAPRLFKEFERDERHEEAGIQGTGLGLSIVLGLARAQGGDTWYEPNQPSGAIFVLRLPASPVAY